MASTKTFIAQFTEFLTNLKARFPDNTGVRKALNGLSLLPDSAHQNVLEGFMAWAKPNASAITSKNVDAIEAFENSPEGVLLKAQWPQSAGIISEIGFVDIMRDPSVEDQTKESIWGYLRNLHIIGTTLTVLPPNLMKSVEGFATQIAENMKNSRPSQDSSSSAGAGNSSAPPAQVQTQPAGLPPGFPDLSKMLAPGPDGTNPIMGMVSQMMSGQGPGAELLASMSEMLEEGDMGGMEDLKEENAQLRKRLERLEALESARAMRKKKANKR